MNPIDTMDSSTLMMAVLIVGFAVVAIFATLGWLYFQSRQRAAKAAKWLAGVYGTWTGLEDSATWERQRASSSLRDWYGVQSQADLDALLEDLVVDASLEARHDLGDLRAHQLARRRGQRGKG